MKEEHLDLHQDIHCLLKHFSDVADEVIVVEVQDLMLEKKKNANPHPLRRTQDKLSG